ncbi:MAG: glycosyltransferase [archaeon]
MDFYTTLAYILAYIGLIATSFYVINLVTYYRKENIPKPSTKEKVTIVIPAYNEEEGMARTIESVLALDYPKEKLEIIVVDDASKDKTLEIAKKFESNQHPKIKVYAKEKNGGKGSALNYGIAKVKSGIIVTMDADTFVNPDALKIMIGYFYNDQIMCVSPSIGIYQPKNILQRIQQIEYYMGVFLRKSFATMNAIHITPGAFSAYRKEFFKKHGDFDTNNLTEDLELALRIQSNDYIIENAPEAAVFTIGPTKFKELLYQRRRWYVGLMRNLWAYRKLFSPKKGALGTIVLPTAVTTVTLSIFLTSYLVIKTILKVKEELVDLSAINFQFNNAFEFNFYTIERIYLTLLSSKLFILSSLFIVLLLFYMKFSRTKIGYRESIRISFVLFAALYSLLFTFWWIISIGYAIFNKKVEWRETNEPK